MAHVVLLGDSIFDNSAYVAGGPDVVRQLQARLPAGSRVSLAARDGARIADVARQVDRIAPDATHFVVSVGGNDALDQLGVLQDRTNSIAAALNRLATIREGFEADYRSMLERVLVRGLPTAICTIYYPRFPEPAMQRLAITGLTIFNDCILLEAISRSLAVLDLRLICNNDDDYANAIEPSVAGGDKIAGAISELLSNHDFRKGHSEIFSRGRINRAARSPHSPLRYHRDWQRQLALQEPSRRSPDNPRSRRFRNPDQLRRRERYRPNPSLKGVKIGRRSGGQIWKPIDRPEQSVACSCTAGARPFTSYWLQWRSTSPGSRGPATRIARHGIGPPGSKRR